MCRSCNEGGRRCSHNWTAERRRQEELAAYARRRINRKKRKAVATALGNRFEGDNAEIVRKAIMATSPAHMALVVDRMEELAPGSTDDVIATMGGGELPGMHNMVIQDLRSESSALDHDRRGNLKNDPLNTMRAAHVLNTIDAVALDTGMATGEEAERLEKELPLRMHAEEIGLISPDAGLPAKHSSLYTQTDYSELRGLASNAERQENKLREHMFRTVKVSAEPRQSLLEPEERYLTPSELAATAPSLVKREGLQVAEDIRLKQDKDGSLYYSVDEGAYRFPALDTSTVENKVTKIPYVELNYDDTAAPPGQRALYQRLYKDPATQKALSEGVMRAAFENPRLAGTMVNMDSEYYEEIAVQGRNSTHTAASMVATSSRRASQFTADTGCSPLANRFMAHSYKNSNRTLSYRASKAGVAKAVSNKAASRVVRANNTNLAPEGMHSLLSSDDSRSAYASEGPIPTARKNKAPASASWFAKGGQAYSDTDVDTIVSRANRVYRTGEGENGPTDHTNSDDLEAYYRVNSSTYHGDVSRAVSEKKGTNTNPTVTMSAYTSIPNDADISTMFAPGAAFSPSEYVAAGVNVPRKPKQRGTRRVRTVYTTSQGAQVTPGRTILGPTSTFRVASVRENRDGTVVVHMVDEKPEDTLLNADAS